MTDKKKAAPAGTGTASNAHSNAAKFSASCARAADFYRWHRAEGFSPVVALGLTLVAAVLDVSRELGGLDEWQGGRR